MSNPVLKAISDRRSIRAYKNEKISREQIDLLLKAAQEAPSARNSQPWHFYIVENTELLKEISDEVSSVAKEDLGNIFFSAPLVIFISCDATTRWGRLDCGIAVQTIALAAHSMGLGSVILGRPDMAFTGPKAEELKKRFKFPETHSFAVAIAIGVAAGTKEAHPIEPDRFSFVN